METRARKRQRLMEQEEVIEYQVPKVTEFIDLNDDVLYAIFNRLPLADLCAVSKTCTRLQSVAGRHFQRKFPNNRLDIEIFAFSCLDDNSNQPKMDLKVLPNEEYAEVFRPFIRNVGIRFYNSRSDSSKAFEYLKKNCCDKLRELMLYRIDCDTNTCGELIKEQLEHLDSIIFDNCFVRDIYSAFLQHSPNLNQIVIKEGHYLDGSMEWTNHRYPKLDKFTYHSSNVNLENLDRFLTLNTQITDIVCSDMAFLRLLIQKSWNLKFLCLCFRDEKMFLQIAAELQAYCEQGHVERLEVEFLNADRRTLEQFAELATLTALRGLHCNYIKTVLPDPIERFNQMTVLSLGINAITKKLLQAMSRSLPNLQELHIESTYKSDSICGFSFKGIITPFVRFAQNVETISLKGVQNANWISGNDLVIADRQRKKVPNAKLLTIYLVYELIAASTFAVPRNCRVQIKPMSQLKPDYRKIF